MKETKITHEEECQAAKYACDIDTAYIKRDCGPEYAEARRLALSLGAHRAFEWLKANGFKVVKNDIRES